MKIKTCEKKEKGMADIVVDVSHEEFESAVGKAFMKNRGQITVPGFRRGKAPRKIIERMLGPTTFHADALEILFPDVVKFVEDESGLKLVGRPHVEDVDIREGDPGGADFMLSASVYPEVTLGEYKGLQVEKQDAKVPESEVDAEVASVRLRNAAMERVDRPAIDGDTVTIDFEGFLDGVPFDGGQGDDYELELGSNSFIPGFEEKLLGIAVGEERDIDLVFPEDYEESLAGRPVVFKVKANEIRERILPDLDDEFAKDVSEFDTFKEYKADIREKLEKARKETCDAAFENALMSKITESLEADVPEAMIDRQQEIATKNFLSRLSSHGIMPDQYLQMMNMTPEIFGDNMRRKAERQVKINLALDKIAELEGVEASAEDIDKEYENAAESYGMGIDELKQSAREEDLIAEIKARKALEIVIESASADEPEQAEKEKKAAEKKPAAKPRKPAAKKTAEKKPEPEGSEGAEE